MIIDVLPFLILSAVAVSAALAMVTARNAVHAAMFLVINLATLAAFFLTLNAPFLAMVQVAVYAGAIMVLFLFVIMLLGAEQLGGAGALSWQRPLALVLVFLLLVEGAYVIIDQLGQQPAFQQALADSSPEAVGTLLFRNYILPFEITSVLLLAAMIGAIVLTLDKEEKP